MCRVVFGADGSRDGTAQTHTGDMKRAIEKRPKTSAKVKVNTSPRFSYLRECSCFMLNTLLHVCVVGGSQNKTRGAEGPLTAEQSEVRAEGYSNQANSIQTPG